MMILKTALFFALSLRALLGFGQGKEYMLSGHVYINNGPACGYNVLLKVDGNTVTGRSVTIQPDGLELHALIKGQINTARHILTFSEAKMPLALDVNNCMFNVELSYALSGGRYVFSGIFAGSNNVTDSCDAGTVVLETKKGKNDFWEPAPRKKKSTVEKDTLTETETDKPFAYEKINAGAAKELEWRSDSVVMEIWDGEVVDGDVVTVKADGRTVLQGYGLVAAKKRVVIQMSGKKCAIAIFAENEGKAPPNTSLLLLWDGNIKHGAEAILHQGETAEIIIRRK